MLYDGPREDTMFAELRPWAGHAKTLRFGSSARTSEIRLQLYDGASQDNLFAEVQPWAGHARTALRFSSSARTFEVRLQIEARVGAARLEEAA